MKHTEQLMVMTAHASGMSFEKADFAHLYKNRDFLAQEYIRGRLVFGELVRVLDSDAEGLFVTKLITVIRTSASEEEAMQKICDEYGLCADASAYVLALSLEELTSLSLQECQEALAYFELMASVL